MYYAGCGEECTVFSFERLESRYPTLLTTDLSQTSATINSQSCTLWQKTMRPWLVYSVVCYKTAELLLFFTEMLSDHMERKKIELVEYSASFLLNQWMGAYSLSHGELYVITSVLRVCRLYYCQNSINWFRKQRISSKRAGDFVHNEINGPTTRLFRTAVSNLRIITSEGMWFTVLWKVISRFLRCINPWPLSYE